MATTRTPTRRNAASSDGATRAGESEPAKREPARRDPVKRDPKPAGPAKKDPPAKSPERKEPPMRASTRGQAVATHAVIAPAGKRTARKAAFIDPADTAATTATPRVTKHTGSDRDDTNTGPRRSGGKRPTQTRDTAPVLPENIALVLQGGGALGAYQADRKSVV